jgi:rRNA maturation RNase YbeY
MEKYRVKFHYIDVQEKWNSRRLIATWVSALLKEEAVDYGDLTYIFCNDSYLIKLNVDYLNHDTYTDILTFNTNYDGKQGIVGEIYISTERVKANALEFRTPFFTELCRVIFHGALHLCGYDDTTKKLKTVMRSKEDYYLNSFGLL